MNINETQTCLNLCEICDFPNIEAVISRLKDNYVIKRIYIGSYFCGNYFLKCNYDKIIKLIYSSFDKKCKITLVIPVPTEGTLDEIKRRLHTIRNTSLENILILTECQVMAKELTVLLFQKYLKLSKRLKKIMLMYL